MSLLPLFLDLRSKPALLVGGGSVARAKLAQLREAKADLRIVATRFSAGFQWEARGLRLQRRPFEPADLQGIQLVVAATNDPAVNAAIAKEARARGIWINAVDDPSACDAFFASTLRRGPVQLAISTNGAFPGLSRSLRLALESLLPDEASLRDFAALRARLRACLPDPAARAEALRALLREFETRHLSLPGDNHDRTP
jgi:siroheme synthase-like protein